MPTSTPKLRQRFARTDIQDCTRLRALAGAPELEHSLTLQPSVLLAASEQVSRWEGRADTEDEDGPLWHGWALHACFVAGVLWAVRQQQEVEEE